MYLRDSGAWSGQDWECTVHLDHGAEIEVRSKFDDKLYRELRSCVVGAADPTMSPEV